MGQSYLDTQRSSMVSYLCLLFLCGSVLGSQHSTVCRDMSPVCGLQSRKGGCVRHNIARYCLRSCGLCTDDDNPSHENTPSFNDYSGDPPESVTPDSSCSDQYK